MAVPDLPETISAHGSGATWQEAVEMFRRLGGTIENIRDGRGRGPGLFVIDSSKPVLLRVPERLLFLTEELEFQGDRLALHEAAPVGSAERDFFEAYMRAASVRHGPLMGSTRFMAALDALPSEVSEYLSVYFGMDELLDGEPDERARNWLLNRKTTTWNGRNVVVPFLERMDDAADGLLWRVDPRGFLHLEGHASGELIVNRGPRDCLGFFRKFGIARAQPQAYSLRLSRKLEAGTLMITRDMSAHTLRGGFPVPRLSVAGDTLALSYLMIGSSRNPRLSRGIFRTLMREAGISDPDDAFDEILCYNRRGFLGLLAALEPHEGWMISNLRGMARYQLEAMTHCVGAREL
ncbi:MAG TPA: hypothetical protein VHX61_05285 [Rhizomicrobium sp.]|jgi:hypothetical protein|nr:hypothetical protein [Rhizomicrobium sp.]